MSTKGAIFFAYNNSELDYIKLAKLSATSIKQHLNLDCTLITDVDVNSDVFDNIIVEEIEYKQNTRSFYDTPQTKFTSQFNNLNKHKVFELSPYDQTILFDVDFLANNAILNLAFDVNSPIQLYRNAQTLKNTEPYHNLDKHLSINGIPMYWSTVIYFDKSSVSKMFFDMWAHVKENYDYYQMLYKFPEGLYRTDYAVSISVHILKGFKEYTDDLISELPASPMKYMAYKDDIAKVDGQGITFFVNDNHNDSKNILTYCEKENLHLMNKRAIMRHYNKLMELYVPNL